VWSREQLERFQHEIAVRGGPSGYYHQYTIRDQAGQLLETAGPHPTVAVLASLNRFGYPTDFAGKTVLDIGCNSGFYTMNTPGSSSTSTAAMARIGGCMGRPASREWFGRRAFPGLNSRASSGSPDRARRRPRALRDKDGVCCCAGNSARFFASRTCRRQF